MSASENNYVGAWKSGRVQGTQWPDKDKIALVQQWLKTGNMALSCKRVKVPYNTALEWKRSEWWKELAEKYREEMDVRLSSQIDDIVDMTMEQLVERIKEGEYILDSKSGEVIRIPAKSRDLATITKLLTDRQDILIKRKKAENHDTATIKDKLSDLANHFASFVKQTNIKKPEVIDGDFSMIEGEVDAIHTTEREEGLQT